MEASLSIPNLSHYNVDVLILVISDNKCGERAPAQTGTLVIDQFLSIMAVKEIQQVDKPWKQVHLGTVLLKQNTPTGSSMPASLNMIWIK